MPKPPPTIKQDQTVRYLDGSEKKLLELFKSSPDYDEYEFSAHGKPWEIIYHLSPRRKALINWLDIPEGARVLELGAGCGALTSHLATLPVAVTAVEGSPARAEVISARLSGAKNVDIICKNISAFNPDEKFDAVFIIGVLEYAGTYMNQPNPYAHLLDLAKSWLKDDGCLVLAIENKFGHKYLAGMPEDHYGKPFVGVSGYPPNSPVRTFDRMELENLMLDSGFGHLSWFAPTPDYKMVDAVLSEKAFMFGGFDPLPLIDAPTKPHSGQDRPLFNEHHFLKRMHLVGRCFSFMNSFLVLASPGGANKIMEQAQQVVAVTQNMDDCPRYFHTETRFVTTDQGLAVHRKYLHRDRPPEWKTGSHKLKKAEKYYSGHKNLLELVVNRLEEGEITRAVELIGHWSAQMEQSARPGTDRQWAEFEEFCAKHVGRTIYKEDAPPAMVPGMLVDAHPGNTLFNPATMDYRYIDLEWKLNIFLPLRLVLDRGFNRAAQEIKKWRPYYMEKGEAKNLFPEFMEPYISRIPGLKHYSGNDLIFFENWFRTAVAKGDLEIVIKL